MKFKEIKREWVKMVILERKYTIKELHEINSFINGFVKGVVDLDKELVALDADMHYELANYLKEQKESKESDMWGFNLWLENQSMDEILEYDSFINIHNNQMHGFPRGGVGWEYWIRILCKRQRR